MLRSPGLLLRALLRRDVAAGAALRTVGLVVALMLPPASLARERGAPVNEWGLPVKDALGQPIEYGQGDLPALTRRHAEAPAGLWPTGVTARWGHAAFGQAIGVSGILVDGDRIYVGGAGYWLGLRYAKDTQSYEQVFVSRPLPSLEALALGDVIGDARRELVAVEQDGPIAVFDPVSGEEIYNLAVPPSGEVDGMTLHDLDGDGKAEILLTTASFWGNTLYVLKVDGSVMWQLAGAGGFDVVVGNMDGDPSLEIATTSGYVVDWATRTIQWQRLQGFGYDLDLGDIDADGRQELIAAQASDFIWAFDVDTQLPKWSLPMSYTGAIRLANVDEDPVLELLVGEAQWGEVIAFDTVTLAREWSIDNPEHGVTFVALGDPNRDGVLDVLWGAGATSSGSDRLYVANLATHTIDWENVQLDGRFVPPQVGDVDGDGSAEVVTASASSEAGYDSGRIVVLDGRTLRVRAISPPVAGNWSSRVNDLRLRNMDGDAALEIVVATDHSSNGMIEIYDFTSGGGFTLNWTNGTRPVGAPFHSVEVADVDADGALEVVGGVGPAHSGSQGTNVYVYSYPGGAEEWHTFTLATSWAPIDGLAVLTQGGGVADIVAMVNGETLNYFSGTGQPQAIVPGDFRFLGPDASSAARSFLLGTGGGEVRQYQRQGSAYEITWSRALAVEPVDGVSMLDGGAMGATSGGRLLLYPARDAPLAWQSDRYEIRGSIALGTGAHRRPFVAGTYATLSLAPWRALVDVQPRWGPFYGGTSLTVSGTAFAPGAELYVGGRTAVGGQVLGPTLATGRTPRLRPCSLNAVWVVNPDMSFEILDDAFRARFGGCPHEPTSVEPALDF